MAQASQQGDIQLVVFRLAEECYALDIGTVQEIIAWQPVTRVPRTEAFVEGLINLRGNVIPVVDLRKRFGLPVTEVGRETRVVVVEIGNIVVGLVVDGVSEVLRVPQSNIEPTVALSGVDAQFIRGVAKTDKRLIILLDVDRLLVSVEQEVLVAATTDSGEEADNVYRR
jgi:purine-binding chemotaxis protein CheW